MAILSSRLIWLSTSLTRVAIGALECTHGQAVAVPAAAVPAAAVPAVAVPAVAVPAVAGTAVAIAVASAEQVRASAAATMVLLRALLVRCLTGIMAPPALRVAAASARS